MRIGELLERRMLLDVTPVVRRHGPKIARALMRSRSLLTRRTFELRHKIGSQVRR